MILRGMDYVRSFWFSNALHFFIFYFGQRDNDIIVLLLLVVRGCVLVLLLLERKCVFFYGSVIRWWLKSVFEFLCWCCGAVALFAPIFNWYFFCVSFLFLSFSFLLGDFFASRCTLYRLNDRVLFLKIKKTKLDSLGFFSDIFK